MKLSSLRHRNGLVDQTSDVALIADDSQCAKNGFVVLQRNGFRKRISTNGLRIPQLPSTSKNGSVFCQEHCKSCQGDNDSSQDKNLVPSPCETATESEQASVCSDTCDSKVVICADSRLAQDKCQQVLRSPSIAHRCASDQSQTSVNRNHQCKQSAVGSTSSSSVVRAGGSVQCKWHKCGCEIASDMLLEHIRMKHVATQLRFSVDDDKVNDEEQSFVCLWNGCKVYNRPSCLLTWLERHIVSHLGDKPYCCIVAGCGARFASQAMLERHVNGHFSGTCSTSLAVSRSLRKGDIKFTRKRKPRSARPYPATSQDFFDSRIMEAIRKQLTVFSASHQSNCEISGNDVMFQHAVVARRVVDSSGQSEVLIQWTPPNVLPNEWLLECDLKLVHCRALPLPCLPDSFAKPSVKHSLRKYCKL